MLSTVRKSGPILVCWTWRLHAMKAAHCAKRSRLHCLACVLVGICALLVVFYCFYLYGFASNQWFLRPESFKPIRSIDAFIEGEEVEASGNSLYSDAVEDIDLAPERSSNVSRWLAELREGSSWEAGSFCDSYFGHTFSESREVCNRVQCRGAAHSNQMGTCTIKGLALLPKWKRQKKRNGIVRDLSDSNSFWLARGKEDANNPFHLAALWMVSERPVYNYQWEPADELHP